MALSTKVKICGITRDSDLKSCIDEGVDAVGFMFYPPSPRFVEPDRVARFSEWMPPFVSKVGVFVNSDLAFVRQTVAMCGLDVVQLHGDEDADYCSQLQGVTVMKALRIRDESSLQAIDLFKEKVSAVLLDAYSKEARGGTGECFDWDLAVMAKQIGIPMILAGGLTPSNVGGAVQTVDPFGVDVSSGVELAKGEKDRQRIRDFVAAVKGATDKRRLIDAEE